MAVALERGDVDDVAKFFTADAVISFPDDDDMQGLPRSVDALRRYFEDGGQFTIDVRALRDIRPASRDVVARFTAKVVLSRNPWTEPVQRQVEVVLRPSHDSGSPEAPGGWSIRSLRM
jgi:hypothetical protein